MYILKLYCNQRDVFFTIFIFYANEEEEDDKKSIFSKIFIRVKIFEQEGSIFNLYFNGYNVEKLFKN